jgi:hypothetical protein
MVSDAKTEVRNVLVVLVGREYDMPNTYACRLDLYLRGGEGPLAAFI